MTNAMASCPVDAAVDTAVQATPTFQPPADARALAAALRTFDELLAVAVDKQVRTLGPATLLDPWRGLHLDRNDVDRLLARSAPATLGLDGVVGLLAHAARAVPQMAAVAARHALADADLALLLVALAVDVDLKYQRIFGYLQDDVARKRPTPDLAANLLAASAEQRLHVLARLDRAAPLIRTGLIDLSAPPESPWLARSLVLDEIALNGLLGRTAVDTALGACARLLEPAPLDMDAIAVEPDLRERLQRAQSGNANATGRLCLLLSGPHGAGKFALANALAYESALRLLVVDARQWSTPAEARAKVERAGRVGLQCGAVLYLHGVAGAGPREPQFLRAIFAALATLPGDVVLVSSTPLAPVPGIALDALRIELGYPTTPVRLRAWQRALAARGRAAEQGALELVAQRFSMGAGQIEQAVADIEQGARRPDQTPLPYADLALAARAQCGAQLAGLAQRITPVAGLTSLVVPPDVRAQLREICARVTARETVRRDWAAGSVHARVVGVTALFAGPSGTGKTLAAEAIANELGFDLYRIDLASIVSKYIGETERNLDRVFTAAEHANAVLFFDEADALFGKRSEVKDAHDRYANIEIAYLLQKMEQFDGLAVLATNLKQNLDEAFARRLTFAVNFPFPEAAERRLLWASLWPPRAPRAADVDLDWFAAEYRLSGGNIRNTILAAAHLAAADGCVVTRTHLLHATRREFQKLGKSIAIPAHVVAREAHA